MDRETENMHTYTKENFLLQKEKLGLQRLTPVIQLLMRQR
jgi:hypothetical protein